MALFSLLIRSTFATIISFTNGYGLNAARLLYPLYNFVPLAFCGAFSSLVLIRIRVISVKERKKKSLGRGKMKEQLLMQRLREPHGCVPDS